MKKNKYFSRKVSDFNIFRRIFQHIACNYFIQTGMKCKYNVKSIDGMFFVNPNKKYIIASNHVTGFDPFFVRAQLNLPIAYMAKKELFEPFWSRLLMDFCGAFAVDRENVGVDTIKTALSIKKTDWNLGIFPQGKRSSNGKMENVTKGFASLSKKMKLDVLPISILISEKPNKNGKFDIQIIIDAPISHECSTDEIYNEWCEIVSKNANLKLIQ